MESLLFNRDIFINELTLESVFNLFVKLQDVKIGYIRNQNWFSNNIKDGLFFYNMNEKLVALFNQFCFSFGFYPVEDYVFYSHPYCGCNNPASIYVKKAHKFYSIDKEDAFINWFNKKKYNNGHFKNLDWCRLSYEDNPDIQLADSIFNKTVFIDKDGNYYTPFNICDKYIYNGGGCSAPIDMGYIKHKNSELVG